MDKKRYEKVDKGIYRNKVNGKYTVSLFLGRTESGKQKKATRTFDTLREAREALADNCVDKANEEVFLPENYPTIDDLMDDFRKMYIDLNTEQTTSRGYAFIEKRIKEFFDKTKRSRYLKNITGTVIDQYYLHLLGIKSKRCPNGLSVNTVRKHRDYLNLIFEYALKHRDVYGLKENPVQFSTLPKGRKSEASRTPDLSWYNTENIAIFVDKLIETKEYPFICAVLLALFGGLRRGEMEYLKWSHVDLKKGRISVMGSRTDAGDVIVEKDIPKSGRTRATSIPKVVVDCLEELKKSQEYYKSIQGIKYRDSDYVIVKPDGNNYSIKWINSRFNKFLKANDFPHIRYHDLRHINASILLQIIPLADVSKHLGHSTPNTTSRIYAHSLMKDENTIGHIFDQLISSDDE